MQWTNTIKLSHFPEQHNFGNFPALYEDSAVICQNSWVGFTWKLIYNGELSPRFRFLRRRIANCE